MSISQRRLYRLIPNDQLENLIKNNNRECQPQQQQPEQQQPQPKSTATKDDGSPQCRQRQGDGGRIQLKFPIRKTSVKRRRNKKQRRVVKWVEL